MTDEEKEMLLSDLQSVPADAIDRIVGIVADYRQSSGDEGVEIDLEMLPLPALWRIKALVDEAKGHVVFEIPQRASVGGPDRDEPLDQELQYALELSAAANPQQAQCFRIDDALDLLEQSCDTQQSYEIALRYVLERVETAFEATARGGTSSLSRGAQAATQINLAGDSDASYKLGRWAGASAILEAVGFDRDHNGVVFSMTRKPDEAVSSATVALIRERLPGVDLQAGGLSRNRSTPRRTAPLNPWAQMTLETTDEPVTNPGMSAGGLTASLLDEQGNESLSRSSSLQRQLSRSSSLTRGSSVASRGIAALARQISNTVGVREEFECKICLDNCLVESSYALPCGHRFCRECIQGYVESRVADAVLVVNCPDLTAAPPSADSGEADLGCAQELSRIAILELVGPESREKYERFEAVAANSDLRECPGRPGIDGWPQPDALVVSALLEMGFPENGCIRAAHHSQSLDEAIAWALIHSFNEDFNDPPPTAVPAAPCGAMVEPVRTGMLRRLNPDMTCHQCGHTFCYSHSNAHPGETCRAYELRTRAAEREAQATISSRAKRCPSCHTPTEKDNGCNHMHCTAMVSRNGRQEQCNQDWCWLCGRKIGGGTYPTHYQWWNVLGCPGTQMNENYQSYGRCRSGCYQLGLCGYRLLAVPIMAVAVALASVMLAIAVAFSPVMIVTVALVRLFHDDWDELKREPGFWLLAATWPVLLGLGLALFILVLALGLGLGLAAVAVAIPAFMVGFPLMRCCVAKCSDNSWDELSRSQRRDLLKLAALWPLIPVVLAAGLGLSIVFLPFLCLCCISDALGWTAVWED